MTIQVPATYTYIPFFDLIADAIYLLTLASKENDGFFNSRCARSSIIASFLSLECFANCLLSSVEISAKLKDELDKLQPLAKIETALQMRGISSFDRGKVEVQKIIELVKARNDFVHSKATKIDVVIQEPQDAGHEWMLPLSMEGEHWNALVLPKVAMFWSSDHSFFVLSAISAFYRYVIQDLMQAENEIIIDNFIPSLKFASTHIPGVYGEFRELIETAKHLGLDFSFLDLSSEKG